MPSYMPDSTSPRSRPGNTSDSSQCLTNNHNKLSSDSRQLTFRQRWHSLLTGLITFSPYFLFIPLTVQNQFLLNMNFEMYRRYSKIFNEFILAERLLYPILYPALQISYLKFLYLFLCPRRELQPLK